MRTKPSGHCRHAARDDHDGGRDGLKGFVGRRLQLWGLLTAAGSLLCCVTCTGFLGRFWWVLDLTSHFRVQYFLLLAGAAVILLIGRKTRVSAVFAGFGLVNLLAIVPLYLGRIQPPPEGAKPFRVMLLNVNTASTSYAAVGEAVVDLNPDLLLLEEVDCIWLEQLQGLTDRYTYSVTRARDDNFGIALFSRFPFTRCEIVAIGEAGVPSISAELDVDGVRLSVVGTHPLPPGGAEYSRLRNDQLAELPKFVNSLGSPLLMLGDLNVTPWCWYFRRLLKRTGLRDSSKGWGVQPSWPASSFLFRIPIDHVLHSPDLRVVGRSIGRDVGSDHFPVIVDLLMIAGDDCRRTSAGILD